MGKTLNDRIKEITNILYEDGGKYQAQAIMGQLINPLYGGAMDICDIINIINDRMYALKHVVSTGGWLKYDYFKSLFREAFKDKNEFVCMGYENKIFIANKKDMNENEVKWVNPYMDIKQAREILE